MGRLHRSDLQRAYDPHVLLAENRRVRQLLASSASAEPDAVYAVDWTGTTTTRAQLHARVESIAATLTARGIGSGTSVACALANSIEHIAIVFALLQTGAVWVPLNTKLRGAALQHQLKDSAATHIIVDPQDTLLEALRKDEGGIRPAPSSATDFASAAGATVGALFELLDDAALPLEAPDPADSVVAVMYTSGTTGSAKGVQLTDSMLIAAAAGVVAAADAREGDVFYMWEPLIHIGGAQMILLPILTRTRLALSAGLSISRFWEEVRAFGATHIHHLGGVLQMLLNRPPSDAERAHTVRVTWGAGATADSWEQIEARFGLTIHECYGLTEVSSIVTVNKGGFRQGIGQPLPWFETALAPRGTNGTGELLVRAKVPGLVTPGYFNRPDATAAARSGDWWRTGDLVSLDDQGNLHFIGRTNDSFRIRGENVSAWQVESVFSSHPLIARCAAVGVQAEVGEQEIMLYVVKAAIPDLDADDLWNWASRHMPEFHIPRYVRFVHELPMTPSHRVAKKNLSRDPEGALDRTAGKRSADSSGRAPFTEPSSDATILDGDL